MSLPLMAVWFKKPLLEKNSIKDPFNIMRTISISSLLLTNSKIHSHVITKTASIPAIDIGRYTIHESQLVNMPLYYRTPEEVREREFVKVTYISMNQTFLDAAIAKNLKGIQGPLPTMVKSAPFI